MMNFFNHYTSELNFLKTILNDNINLDEIKKTFKNPYFENTATKQLAVFLELQELVNNKKAIFKYADSNIKRFNLITQKSEFLGGEAYINGFLFPETIPSHLTNQVLNNLPKLEFPLLPVIINYCENNLKEFPNVIEYWENSVRCLEIETRDMTTYIIGGYSNGE